MIKINLKELHRTKWIYLILMIELIFYSYILYTEPFSSDKTTIFLQITFILNMIFGANYAFRLTNEDYKDVMDSFHRTLHRYISASFATIFIVNLINFLLLSLIALIMFYMGKFPLWLFKDLILVNFIYFLINNVSCAVGGFIIGFLIPHRIKYLFLLILSFIVSPVSKFVLPYIGLFSTFNLGPYSIDVTANYLYGFDTEITRLFKFLTILIALLFLCLILLYQRIKAPKLIPIGVLLLVTLVVSAWQWSLPAWLRRPFGSNGDPLAEYNYDFKYYSGHLSPDPEKHPINYQIQNMNINLWLKREALFEVEMTLEGLFDQDLMYGSLYHGFQIDQVIVNGQEVPFQQERDLFTINLPLKEKETKQVTLRYKGLSSPYLPGNYKACVFPAYFNWLPLARVQPAVFIYDGYNANFSAAYNPNMIDYELTLHANSNKTAFSSLDKDSDGVFRGRSDRGISLYYGNLYLGSEDMVAVASIPKKEVENLADKVESTREYYQSVAKKYGIEQSDLPFKFIVGLQLRIPYNRWSGFEDYGIIKTTGLEFPPSEHDFLLSLIYGSYELRRQPNDVQDLVVSIVDGMHQTDKRAYAFTAGELGLEKYFELPIEQREETVKRVLQELKEGKISKEVIQDIVEEKSDAGN